MSPSRSFRARRRDPVHHLFIDRGAHRPRIAPVALERRPRVMLGAILLGELVELFRRKAGPDHLPHLFERAPHDQSGPMHLFKFGRRLTDDHFSSLPSASRALHQLFESAAHFFHRRPCIQQIQHAAGGGNTRSAAWSASRKPPAALSPTSGRSSARCTSLPPSRSQIPATFGGAS